MLVKFDLQLKLKYQKFQQLGAEYMKAVYGKYDLAINNLWLQQNWNSCEPELEVMEEEWIADILEPMRQNSVQKE